MDIDTANVRSCSGKPQWIGGGGGGGEGPVVRSTVRISRASVSRTRGCEGLALQASVAPTVS